MEILAPILVVLAVYYMYRLIRLLIKRAVVIKKLKALDGNYGMKTEIVRGLFKGLLRMSEDPDAIVSFGDKVYLIRFYNGRGRKTQAHFANEEYSVIFSILKIKSFFSLASNIFSPRAANVQSISSIRIKVKILPKLRIPDKYKDAEDQGVKVVPVFLFNPTPSNVSYVSDERTSIKLAFTGDEFRGIRIFTGSSFVSYAEREARGFIEFGESFK